MTMRDELLRQAKEARALATKAHRLAMGTNSNDAARLIAYAQELDDTARALEGRALGSELFLPPVGPVVGHSQQQAQQQSESGPASYRAAPRKE